MNNAVSTRVIQPLLFASLGQPVLSRLADLRASEGLSHGELAAHRLVKLQKLIAHAWTLPFYRDLWRRHGAPETIEDLNDLSGFPYISADDLPDLLSSLGGRIPRNCIVRRTTGSTGRPNVVLASATANAWSLAARFRSQGWYGVGIGDRQVRLWGRPSLTSRSREKMKDLILNRLRLDGSDFTKDRVNHTLKKLARFDPTYIYGYPSLLNDLAAGLATGLAPTPDGLKVAICTAETSLPHERRQMSDILGCPVVNEYGCSETDIVAFECPQGSLHIIAENVVVETRNNDQHQEGLGELVLTDLNNDLMPLIRYAIGDLGQLAASPCDCGLNLPVLARLGGRLKCNFVITPAGDRIHTSPFAYLFEYLVEKGYGIRRFKTIQEELDSISFYVVMETRDSSVERRIEQYLVQEVAAVVGDQMRCLVHFPDELPKHSSVKFSHFESRILDNENRP